MLGEEGADHPWPLLETEGANGVHQPPAGTNPIGYRCEHRSLQPRSRDALLQAPPQLDLRMSAERASTATRSINERNIDHWDPAQRLAGIELPMLHVESEPGQIGTPDREAPCVPIDGDDPRTPRC
jgi:hypothetical protein